MAISLNVCSVPRALAGLGQLNVQTNLSDPACASETRRGDGLRSHRRTCGEGNGWARTTAPLARVCPPVRIGPCTVRAISLCLHDETCCEGLGSQGDPLLPVLPGTVVPITKWLSPGGIHGPLPGVSPQCEPLACEWGED